MSSVSMEEPGTESVDDDLESIQQPDRFDLELELVRWVKIAASKTIPPVMGKPAGPITQHYGLDSKSRWREAICVMMLEADPHLETEGTNKLGRQLAQLFRQDLQLWEVKARQLHNWVKRGLTNVKLLDRTLAYFQNQSSWLQYIKNLKNPIPMIETPGFPGTQWSEHYWKEQTVMLLMQESDFPNGSDPVFCSRLFREEPGKWKLKMEQFKSWLERGKTDPLPEYFGTGKNCPECGLFLWDTRSFLKHMKRNHGVKINDREKSGSGRESPDGASSPPLLFISDKGNKSPSRDENNDSISAEKGDDKNGANLSRGETADPDDKFCATSDSEPSTSQATSSRHSTPSRPSGAGGSTTPSRPSPPSASPTSRPTSKGSGSALQVRSNVPGINALSNKSTGSRGSAVQSKSNVSKGSAQASKPSGQPSNRSSGQGGKRDVESEQQKGKEDKLGVDEEEGDDSGPSLLSLTLPSRSAASKREERQSGGNPTVSCPECNYKCSHSKIVDHLLRCTKKSLAAAKKSETAKAGPPSSRTGRLTQSGRSTGGAGGSAVQTDRGGRSRSPEERAVSPKLAPAESSSAVPSSSRAKDSVSSASSTSSSSKPRSSPFQKTNNIVKKVFWKKFEQERQQQNRNRESPEPYKSPDSSSYRSPEQTRSPDQYKPPLKLKLSRREGSHDSSFFEINKPIISSLLRQNMNRLTGGQSPLSDRSPSHPRSPVPSPSYRSPIRSPTPTEGGVAVEGSSSPAHYTAISSTVTSPRTQPLPTTPSPVDLSMKPGEDTTTKLPPPVRVIIKKYEIPKQDDSNTTETEEEPTVAEPSIDKDTDTEMKDESGLPGEDSRPRRGQARGQARARAMLSCPLCTSEFSILSNLEKHIDREHKDIEKPVRKRRSVTMKKSESASSLSNSSSPPKRSRKSTGDRPASKLDDNIASDTNTSGADTSLEDASLDPDDRKLTEYEIFQSLQLKSKNERRKIRCSECGAQIPPNNMKRHMERHNNKFDETEDTDKDDNSTQGSIKRPTGMEKCTICGKEMKKNMIKRHLAKHKREDATVDPPVAVGSSTSPAGNKSPAGTDDRIPCKECGKRLPKCAMKRHLMKHEADNFMPCTGKSSEDEVKLEPELQSTAGTQPQPEESTTVTQPTQPPSSSPSQKQPEVKSKGERKKITCDICGLSCAPNTYKRHMDRHKREEENEGEVFAPIEITPTKDYWEMNDIKPNLDKIKSNLTTSSTDNQTSQNPPKPTTQNPSKTGRGNSSRNGSSSSVNSAILSAVFSGKSSAAARGRKDLDGRVKGQDLTDGPVPSAGSRKDGQVSQAGGRTGRGKKDSPVPTTVEVKLEATSEYKPDISKESSIKPSEKQLDDSGKKTGKRSISGSPANTESVSNKRSLSGSPAQMDTTTTKKSVSNSPSQNDLPANKQSGNLAHTDLEATKKSGSSLQFDLATLKKSGSHAIINTAGAKKLISGSPAHTDTSKLSVAGSPGHSEAAKRSVSSSPAFTDSGSSKSDENSSAERSSSADKKVNKYIKEVQEQEKGKVSGSDEEGEGPLEQAVRKVVSYKMTPKQALQIYNLTPKVLFDYLLGETDDDRMAILKRVNLKSTAEEQVIQFCTENEDHLSYKSVISFVKDLKHKDGDEDFTLSRLEAYRWWYAFRKKFDLKITAKKK